MLIELTHIVFTLIDLNSERNKIRTKTIKSTNEPRWNQSFVYSALRRSDLKAKALELTVWDLDENGMNEFLGEVVIELATAPLDDQGAWYLLETHEETIAQLVSVFFEKKWFLLIQNTILLFPN